MTGLIRLLFCVFITLKMGFFNKKKEMNVGLNSKFAAVIWKIIDNKMMLLLLNAGDRVNIFFLASPELLSLLHGQETAEFVTFLPFSCLGN